MIIDYARDALLTDFALTTLKSSYLVDGETSPQQAFARAAQAFADDEAHAQRLYDYASNLWFMFATPVLSNGGTKRGLPISPAT
jgi:ribonucleoside-diphosphate reductase alpha chain